MQQRSIHKTHVGIKVNTRTVVAVPQVLQRKGKLRDKQEYKMCGSKMIKLKKKGKNNIRDKLRYFHPSVQGVQPAREDYIRAIPLHALIHPRQFQ